MLPPSPCEEVEGSLTGPYSLCFDDSGLLLRHRSGKASGIMFEGL